MRRNAVVGAILLCSVIPSFAMRRDVIQHVNAEDEMRGLVDEHGGVESNSTEHGKAFFCPSLCIPCAFGDRTLYIARSKGMFKTVLDVGVVALIGATGGWIGGLVGAVGAALGLGSYAVGDHLLAHKLADECPAFQLNYFDADEFTVAPDDVEKLMDEADENPMFLFKKQLSKLFHLETGRTRKIGQLPPSINALLDEAQFFCGAHGGAVQLHMKEESWIHGMHGWLTGDFSKQCKVLHQEFHTATEDLEKLKEEQVVEDEEDTVDPGLSGGDPKNDNGGEILHEEDPANRIEDIGEIDEGEEVVVTPTTKPKDDKPKKDDKPVAPVDKSCPQKVAREPKTNGCVNAASKQPVAELCCEDVPASNQEPAKVVVVTTTEKKGPSGDPEVKPTVKPRNSDVPALVIKKDDPGGNDGDEDVVDDTYYLDGKDDKVKDTIDEIDRGRKKLITVEKMPYNACSLVKTKVHAFGCEHIAVDNTCKCRYLRPQKCDQWFFGGTTIKPITLTRGLLLLTKDKCECYGSKTSSYCDFGFLSHVPNIGIAN